MSLGLQEILSSYVTHTSLDLQSSHVEESESRLAKDEDVDISSDNADAHIIRLLPDEFNMVISNKDGCLLDESSPDLPDPPKDLPSPNLRRLMGHTSAERASRLYKGKDEDGLVLIRVRKGDPIYMCLINDDDDERNPSYRYRDDTGAFMDERDIVWLNGYREYGNRMDAYSKLLKEHKDWVANQETLWKKSMRMWRQERRTIEAMIVHNEVSLGKSHLFTSWAACKAALPALNLFVTRENAREYGGEIDDVFTSKYETRFYALTPAQIQALDAEADTFFEARRAPDTNLIEIPDDNMTPMSQCAYVRLYNRAAAMVELQREAEKIERTKNGKHAKLFGTELQASEMSLQLQKKWQMRKHANQIFKRALKSKSPKKDRELRDLITKWHRTIHEQKYFGTPETTQELL